MNARNLPALAGERFKTKLKAHIVSRGKAEGYALVSSSPISFLGSIDVKTGIVIEKGHELEGISIKGKVLVFPGGKGSTVGSYSIYQLKKNGAAPSAMINIRTEPIVAVGAIISDIPLVDNLEQNPVTVIKNGDKVLVDAILGSVEIL
jgi:predicted aconitase with swiveling domain